MVKKQQLKLKKRCHLSVVTHIDRHMVIGSCTGNGLLMICLLKKRVLFQLYGTTAR